VMSRVQSKRKRITYGPMEERDKFSIDYLNIKIYKDDTVSTKMIRFKRKSFFRLCQLLRERTLLRDTVHVCIEEQLAIFLNTVGHNLKNRVVGTNFMHQTLFFFLFSCTRLGDVKGMRKLRPVHES
jgi:hypothetical protein